MIHVQCPDCDSTLAVKDIYAGKLARCPICQSKVRIPIEEVEAADDAPDERVSSAPKSRLPAQSKRPRRRIEEEDEEERPRRRIEEDEPPARPQRKPIARRNDRSEDIQEVKPARPSAGPDDDDDEEVTFEIEEPQRPKPRKKKRRRIRRREESEGFSISDVDWGKWMLIGLGVVALIGFGSMAAAFAFPPFMLIPIAVGFLFMAVGNIWFLIIAFQDDVLQGVLCLLLGFYRLYYLIANFDEVKIPFFVELLGWLMVIGGFCAGGAFTHPPK